MNETEMIDVFLTILDDPRKYAIVLLMLFGVLLKHLLPISNKLIPWVLLVLGGGVAWMLYAPSKPLSDVLLIGLMYGILAVGSHQYGKQALSVAVLLMKKMKENSKTSA